MAAIISNKSYLTFKNMIILKPRSSSICSSSQVIVHRKPIELGIKLTMKKKKRYFVTCCSKVTSPSKDGEFPSKNWWKQKLVEFAFEFAKVFTLWICGWLYKKHLFLTNLPFAKGDLVQLKVDGNLICGLVEEVGGTKIFIRGADDDFLNYVPNSEVDAKFVKILNLVTVVKAPSVQVVSADAKNAGVDTEKDPKKKAHDSSNVLKGKNTSEDQVGAELRLWGITINMELTFESYNLMNEKITKIREFLTSDSLVREHELIMVSFESYLPDKKAFKILVGFFVEAQKNIKEYSDIKAYFLMKLVETVNTQ